MTQLVGDFNRDGRSDVALAGVPGIPVAYSKGDGTFEEVSSDTSDANVRGFAGWSRSPGVSHLVGDFDGNGSSDIALVGGKNWRTIPVAFSREKE